MMKKAVIFLLAISLLAAVVCAADIDTTRQLRLQYGDVIRIDKIGTFPSEIAPGAEGIISVEIRNAGETEIKDVVVKITPPSGVSFLDDVSKRKFPSILPGDTRSMNFTVIASPAIIEGVYPASISISY